jgi:hypothetical protein
MSAKKSAGVDDDPEQGESVISFNVDFESDSFSGVSPEKGRDIDLYDIEKQKAIRYGRDTIERQRLAHWVTRTVSLWLFCVIIIIVLRGFCVLKMSDAVTCMLLGTTTINILGLAYILLKGLFPNPPKDN